EQRARRWIDAIDGARDQDLGAEAPRLLEGAARELVARDAARESEIVLDARRRPGLSARRLALDDDRAQAFRRAVHGGGEARRAAADDRDVVLALAGAGRESEANGELAHAGPRDDRAVRQPEHREIRIRGKRPFPSVGELRRIRQQPLERDLVAREKPPDVAA